MTNVEEVLSDMQKKLKVSKEQYNYFGKYKYRNAEDILDAAKEIEPEGASTRCSDALVVVLDRIYVEATATLLYKGKEIAVKAYAREPLIKKGMDESQITGAASSYARKYALSGLFALSDTKDADSMENKESHMSPTMQEFVRLVNEKKVKSETITKWKEWANVQNTKDIPDDKLKLLILKMKEKA